MRVLLLTPIPHYLVPAIEAAGDRYDVSEAPPGQWPDGIDFIVSFGYRHIIPQRVIDAYGGRLINIHISFLPWNRGADPNFWSWFDRTPKGISIHAIDAGIDTGDILTRHKAVIPEGHTLRSSYAALVNTAAGIFAAEWPKLRQCNWSPVRAGAPGTYHRMADKEQWMNKLPLGWDTPVKDVEELGAASKGN